MNTEKLKKDIQEFIERAQDTTEHCEKSLLCAALLALHEDPSNTEEAKRRLHEIVDSGSRFIEPPSFLRKEQI